MSIKKILVILLKIVVSLFFSVITHIVGLYFYFWVHELGHVIFSFTASLIAGKPTLPYISAWTPYLFWFILVPHQVMGYSSMLHYFGGTLTVMLLTVFLSVYNYMNKKDKTFLLFIPLLFYLEFFGNFLCGTDNHTGKALIDCSSGIIRYWGYSFHLFSILLIAVLLFKSEFLKSKKIIIKT